MGDWDEVWAKEVIGFTKKSILCWLETTDYDSYADATKIKDYLNKDRKIDEIELNPFTSETKKRFFYLVKEFRMTHDKMVVLLWGMAIFLDKRMGQVINWIKGNLGGLNFTKELASEIYYVNYPQEEQKIRMLEQWEYYDSIWEEDGDEFKIRNRVLYFLIYGDWDLSKNSKWMRIFEPWRWKDTMKNDTSLEETFHTKPLDWEYLKNIKKIFLYGEKGVGKRYFVQEQAFRQNKVVLFLDYSKMIKKQILISEIIFECVIRKAWICVEYTPNEESRDDFWDWMEELMSFSTMLLWICDVPQEPKEEGLTDDDWYIKQIKRPDLFQQREYWRILSKGRSFENEVELNEFADRFDFTPAQIKGAIKFAIRFVGEGKAINTEALRKGCFSQLDHRLEQRATKIQTSYRLEDLILPDKSKKMLLDACNQIIYRNKVFMEWGLQEKLSYGRGVSMLFTGSPGTGKTMAAQVVASILGLELYRIDLATVVSKYIGETERNLKMIFDEAEKSQGIIFFDEADVLFSKRTEIKDSNDKYSNMEAAFLLQRMEAYEGMVILATNYLQNIDDAFKRRLSYVIEFPIPGPEERTVMWKKAIPEKMPIAPDIDFEYFGKQFVLTGSNIRNVVRSAAYFAASETKESEKRIEMTHLLQATIFEFEKSGKKLTKEELGIYYTLI